MDHARLYSTPQRAGGILCKECSILPRCFCLCSDFLSKTGSAWTASSPLTAECPLEVTLLTQSVNWLSTTVTTFPEELGLTAWLLIGMVRQAGDWNVFRVHDVPSAAVAVQVQNFEHVAQTRTPM